MFAIVVESPLGAPKVIGPFPHEEDADLYAAKHLHGLHIWRIVPLTAP